MRGHHGTADARTLCLLMAPPARHRRARPCAGLPSARQHWTSGLVRPALAAGWTATRQRSAPHVRRRADQVGGGRGGPPLAARRWAGLV